MARFTIPLPVMRHIEQCFREHYRMYVTTSDDAIDQAWDSFKERLERKIRVAQHEIGK